MAPFTRLRSRMASVLQSPSNPHETRGASIVRPVVFGASDGLVSNLALIMGVGAAAGDEGHTVLLAGIAGLLAGAFSMAVGEYISVRSQREVLDYQVALQRSQLRDSPEAERAILISIYTTKGLSPAEAQLITDRVMAEPEMAVETFVREEIGLSKETMGSPAAAAASSFTAFSIGAVVPVIPYVFLHGGLAFWSALIVSLVALFVVGAAVSMLTHRSPIAVGLRQAGLGLAAAAVTYAIGALIGASVA